MTTRELLYYVLGSLEVAAMLDAKMAQDHVQLVYNRVHEFLLGPVPPTDESGDL